MRDIGIGMPAVVVVFSPNTDLTLSGDTVFTLRNADPVLDVNATKNLIAAYADPSDQRTPYASPIYGNFSKGFPPTLIQVGTKEILLSDSSFVSSIRPNGYTSEVRCLRRDATCISRLFIQYT